MERGSMLAILAQHRRAARAIDHTV
jgi:hypothetical protein